VFIVNFVLKNKLSSFALCNLKANVLRSKRGRRRRLDLFIPIRNRRVRRAFKFQDVRKTARRGQERRGRHISIKSPGSRESCTPKYCINFEDRLGCIYMSEFLKAPMSHLNPGLVVRFTRVLSIMAGERRPGITKVDGSVPSGVQRPRVVLQLEEDRSLLRGMVVSKHTQ
jgi:hypothetical protein